VIESPTLMDDPTTHPHRLDELLEGLAAPGIPVPPTPISGVAYDSRRVARGDAFFCVPGFLHDGHRYAAAAVRHGASALVVEHPVAGVEVPQVVVRDTRTALAVASSRIHGEPSGAMQVVGITGTNGKTTSSYLLESILREAGRVTGLVGTVETRIAGASRPAGRTTPESADLQALLAEMLSAGVDAVVMEVSSHAIDLHRVDAVRFAVAAFTNLSQDHLDYHGDLEEYFEVKRRLFTDLAPGRAVVDIDDERGAALAAELAAAGATAVLTVGRDESADVRAVDDRPGPVGTRFTILARGEAVTVELPLLGRFNVDNALVAAGCALALGLAPATVADGLSRAPQVPGRLERIDAGQPFAVLVDYAHTPDGLEKAIEAVRAVTPGRVIVVFGCGGDRDPDKRPLMGRAAGSGADHVVATSDNPRSEDPVGILLAVEDGLRQAGAGYEIEVDRRRAIARALDLAKAGDAVLIAGKGHEDYQMFADRTIHFDDREAARAELEARWS
jgi:UDP-N-acetylmuramoyl-L-alanyl-D-glutamate--2,6-diaminopimelate ligase